MRERERERESEISSLHTVEIIFLIQIILFVDIPRRERDYNVRRLGFKKKMYKIVSCRGAEKPSYGV